MASDLQLISGRSVPFIHLTHANEGDLTAVLVTGNAAFHAEI